MYYKSKNTIWYTLSGASVFNIAATSHVRLLSTFVHANSLQSCPTLCNPIDHRPPGSSVHGILQARILE